ncbi:alpha-tocopherol transfer protein-like [Tenebrio molitor]|uniref:alpha-tocopherol transfer protein-like n=1 Tax=Tenebrio molitor TaxID=7067 RepID=UPI001C3A02F0|nr:unnamed protein product [Tenebrio molitor]
MTKEPLFEVENDVLDKVIKHYGRSKKSFDDDVATIRRWMSNQLHFPEILDNKIIENFLIMNKCSIERTKEKIDMYYTVRSTLEDIYGSINPHLPHMQESMEIFSIVPHPKLTKEMNRVFFSKVRKENLMDKLQPENCLRFVINLQEIRIREDVAFGDILVGDWNGVCASFITKISPTMLYKTLVVVYEKVFSARLKAVYCINMHPISIKIMELAKKIMKPKLAARIHILPNAEELKQHIPEDILPKEFGGTGSSFDELHELLKKKMLEEKNLFDHLDKLRVNENLRPEKLTNDEKLGFYGNFKKLDLD